MPQENDENAAVQEKASIKGRAVIITAMIAVVLVVAYWPVLRWLVNSWLGSEFYSHGFIIPLVSVFFIRARRQDLKAGERSYLGIIILAAGVLLYGLDFIWQTKTLGAVSLVIVITGICLLALGARAVGKMAFPLAFLFFMVPFPFIPDLAYNLQEISIGSSAGLVGALGLPVTTSGTEIYLGNIVFTIGLPCSGINTFIALLALAAVYGYILRGPAYRRWLIFILAFPVAVGANILRISTIIMVVNYASPEAATGWFHGIYSLVFFFLAFGVVVVIGWAMRCRLDLFGVKQR